MINCSNSGDITQRTGGDAGGVTSECKDGAMINCYNTGKITSLEQGHAAGITTTASNLVINCYNTGDVKGSVWVGGIAANESAGGKIINCYNTGNISWEENYNDYHDNNKGVGGIIGLLRSGQVINCYNSGEVTDNRPEYTGTIIGQLIYNEINSTSSCYCTAINNYSLQTEDINFNINNIGAITGDDEENINEYVTNHNNLTFDNDGITNFRRNMKSFLAKEIIII